MKNLKLAIGATALLLASAFTVLELVTYKIKDNYSVKFKGGKVDGIFKGLKATIMFDEANPEKSKITATIDASTANTGNGIMNKHAKSESGLNTEKYPTITFESTSIRKDGTSYVAGGNLTLKGVTKQIKLPFTFANDVFNGKFSILPKDFGVTRSGTPNEVEVELNIPVTK